MTPERYLLAARLAGYLGEWDRALAVLTEGLEAHPRDIRLLHQRGTSRLITRSFTEALADLEAAVQYDTGQEVTESYREQVVSDVLDLVLGHPVSAPPSEGGGSVRVAVRLHLGLTRYLLGDYAAAAQQFGSTAALADAPYQQLAALDWEYLSLHRCGQSELAQQLIDNLDWDDYRLGVAASTTAQSLERCYVQRLRLYQGQAQPEELLRATSVEGIHVATLGYGVGAWYRYRGYDSAAERTFARILEVGDPTTMGYLAAETEARSARFPAPHPARFPTPHPTLKDDVT